MSRFFIIVLILAVGGVAGGVYYVHQQKARAAAADVLPMDVYVAAATTGDITQSVSSPGQVISNLDVAIKCRASGEVTKMPFDISDSVKKGDLLMQLDEKDEQVLVDQAKVKVDQDNSHLIEAQQAEAQAELDLQTAIEKADAGLTSCQIKATNLRNKADRQQELLTKNLASKEDYETAQSDSAQADNDLQAARIAKEEIKSQQVALDTKKEDIKLAQEQVRLDGIVLTNAQQQLDYTTITAPMDGVISDIPITIGMGTIIASAISNVSGGTTVMTLTDLSHLFVMATVDESDIGGVQVGQTVNITADSFPGKRFQGKVVRIATTGVTASNVVTFQVKIEITSENKTLLKPEMTANVQIIEASKQNILMAPMLAVVNQKRKVFVTVQKPDGTTEDRDVVTGINDGDNIEIVSGLTAGDKVMVHKNEAANKWTAQGPQRPLSMPGGGGGRRG